MTYATLAAFLLGAIAEAVLTIGFCFWQDWREQQNNDNNKDNDQ